MFQAYQRAFQRTLICHHPQSIGGDAKGSSWLYMTVHDCAVFTRQGMGHFPTIPTSPRSTKCLKRTNEDGCGSHGTSGRPAGLRYVDSWPERVGMRIPAIGRVHRAIWRRNFSNRRPPRTQTVARPFQAYQRAFLRTLSCLRALSTSGVMRFPT